MNRTGEPAVSYAEAVRRIQAADAANPGREYSTASLAEVTWPANRFLSRQGAALAFGRFLSLMIKGGIVEPAKGGRTWKVRSVRSAANR